MMNINEYSLQGHRFLKRCHEHQEFCKEMQIKIINDRRLRFDILQSQK